MIEFLEARRLYGEKIAVDGLNLRIDAGELYALLGHNGAGKTTAIKMLVGLLRPSTGTVRVGGFDLVEQTREAVALIGYVPDHPFLYDKLSGRELLEFVARMHGMNSEQAGRAIDREIGRFELAGFVDELTESYSHGMKQRVAFAAALLHRPRVLVIDEPLVGLDPHSIRMVKELLRAEVAAGMCVLMSTHTLSAAEEIAGRVGIMHYGRLIYTGTVTGLRQKLGTADMSLESLYLALTEPMAEVRTAQEASA
jgi:ABC-2 type transport system ATP-binding protein